MDFDFVASLILLFHLGKEIPKAGGYTSCALSNSIFPEVLKDSCSWSVLSKSFFKYRSFSSSKDLYLSIEKHDLC